jgi:hypothetical protein
MKKQSMLFKVSIFAVVFFLLSILPLKCQAQMTTTSSTGIVDSDSSTWASATVTATFLPNPNYPNVKPSPLTYTTTANSSGAFSLAVPDNNYVAAGSTYQFTICSFTSAQCSVLNPLTITGGTQNLTTYINSAIIAPRFAANNYGAYGYADGEVTPTPLPGMSYYNVITPVLRQWNGSSWTSAGGGAVTSVFGRTGAVVAAAGDYSAFYLQLNGSNTMTGTINETNSSASATNLINVTGNAGSWAGFAVAENSSNTVLYSSNQFAASEPFDTESSSLQHGLSSTNGVGFRYGLGFSCSGTLPNNACVSGYFQENGANVLNLSNGIAGTGAMTLNLIGTLNSTNHKTAAYTVATLPAATVGAGITVTVTDATSFTPGTCTGGGSDYMIAVSNGTTWSCH